MVIVHKRFLSIAALVILATVGLWYFASPADHQNQGATNASETGVTAGKVLPQFTLSDLAGHELTVGRADKLIVINFWATWCPPCLAEMPELNRFVDKHQADVAFLAINIQEPVGKVADFMTQNNYKMQVLLDKDGSIAKNFRVSAIPTTIVADKNGVVKYRKSGGITMSELEGVIKGL
jgi:cytochrome c biogenesis protein CcmG, thiol:disulfide interchange protein DsbE